MGVALITQITHVRNMRKKNNIICNTRKSTTYNINIFFFFFAFLQ